MRLERSIYSELINDSIGEPSPDRVTPTHPRPTHTARQDQGTRHAAGDAHCGWHGLRCVPTFGAHATNLQPIRVLPTPLVWAPYRQL